MNKKNWLLRHIPVSEWWATSGLTWLLLGRNGKKICNENYCKDKYIRYGMDSVDNELDKLIKIHNELQLLNNSTCPTCMQNTGRMYQKHQEVR